jgi:hypothetical protein
MFPIVSFSVCQILGIIGSQIGTKRILFSIGHFYKPKKMLFIIEQFKKIDLCELTLLQKHGFYVTSIISKMTI